MLGFAALTANLRIPFPFDRLRANGIRNPFPQAGEGKKHKPSPAFAGTPFQKGGLKKQGSGTNA